VNEISASEGAASGASTRNPASAAHAGAAPRAAAEPDLRIYRYTAPALLSALAIAQLIMGTQFDLSPWKGGGFGMFSTVDSPAGRMVRVYLDTGETEIPTRLPGWVMRRDGFTRSFPTEFRLRGLVDDLAAASWFYVNRKVEPDPNDADSEPKPDGDLGVVVAAKPAATDASDEGKDLPYPRVSSRKPGREPNEKHIAVPVAGVRIEVWRRRYDAATNTLRLEKVNEAQARVAGQ